MVVAYLVCVWLSLLWFIWPLSVTVLFIRDINHRYSLNLCILFTLFLAVLGLHCCTQALSSCGKWGLLFVEVYRLLIVVASLVEHVL